MHLSMGGTGGQSHLKNHKNLRFLSNTGQDPLLPSQHSMLGHHLHASKMPFNGVLLAGQWWPAHSGMWILPSTKKNTQKMSKLDPLDKNFLDPCMGLHFFMHLQYLGCFSRFNPGRQENVPIWLKNCWLGHKASKQTISKMHVWPQKLFSDLVFIYVQ